MYSAHCSVDFSPTSDLHRPGDLALPVCLGALARRYTLFNTPPNPRPLTPPQGWRQGSNITIRLLTPCSLPSLGSVRSARPPWLATARADALISSKSRSPGRARLDLASPVCFASLPALASSLTSCCFALLLHFACVSFFKKIHKAAAILPRLDGVSVWLHRRLIHLIGFANKNLRLFFFYQLSAVSCHLKDFP